MPPDPTTQVHLLPRTFIARLAAGDPQIAKAAGNLNSLIRSFVMSFTHNPIEAPACRVLASRGASMEAHVASHLAVAHWLLGVRMKEHLSDLMTALLNHRVFNAALTARAFIESAAAAVYLQEKLESTLVDRSKEAYQSALDELHRSIGGGRFDWFTAHDDGAMLKSLELYRAGDDPEVPSERRATSILTMLVKLDRRVHRRFQTPINSNMSSVRGGIVRAIYAQLCDICHPATGTAILLTEPARADGWIRARSMTGERETRWFFWNIGSFVPPVGNVAYEALSRLNTLVAEP